ncbi:MAG: polysaccharide deacetylase family protein [Pseudomonadales bacterium]|nr:polysaccharide deacetylase family protein [Pseudomonadales bacterium]
MLSTIIKKLIIHSGLFGIIRNLLNIFSGPGITFMYGHRVLTDEIMANPDDPRRIAGQSSVSEITELIKSLSKHYHFISIDEALDQINNNSIKRESIVLTFDDGFQDNYLNLLPILKEFSVPAVFYVNSSVISTEKNLWFQEIINFFFAVPDDEIHVVINDKTYDLSSPQKRFDASFNLMRYLQANKHPTQFDEIIRTIAGDLAKPSALDRHLTWEDLKNLSKENLITLGAHTVHHYPLALCNSELSNIEITNSITHLENKLAIKIKHFSFPRGNEGDFNDTHINQIKNAGLISAVSTVRGVTRSGADNFQIKRVGLPKEIIGKTDDLLWHVAGFPQLIASVKSAIGLSQ